MRREKLDRLRKESFSARSKKIIQPSSANGGDQKRQGGKLDSLRGLTGANRPTRRKSEIQSRPLNEVGSEISTGLKQARGTGSK
jgi:hypothetical protein